MFFRYIRRLKINKNVNRPASLSFLIMFLSLGAQGYLFAQSSDDCLMCHEDETLTMEKEGREISLFVNSNVLSNSTHKNLSCVSCHVGFNPEELPHKENITPIDCKLCHKDAPTKHQFHPQMLRNKTGTSDVSCKNCHGTHDVVSPKVNLSKWSSANLSTSCGNCHKDEKEMYVKSWHYKGLTESVKGAPNCITCHQNASIVNTIGADTIRVKIAQEKLCLSCHLDDPQVRIRTSPSAGFLTAYEHSVHGSSLMKGNSKVANCVNCHTSHNIQPGSNSTSTVNKMNIPVTCGQCHKEIAREYKESIHGVSLMKGNIDAPACIDCHGEHNILDVNNPEAPVASQNVSEQVCAPCHSSVKLAEKFGISSDRIETFQKSYHGLASRGGSVEVANCASCHGVHNIKPPGDPTSTVNKKNLAETCGTCHPGANENFAVGKIHVSMEKKDEPILYWIATFYIMLIVVIIGGMFLHNLVDFIRKAKIKKLKQLGLIRTEPHGHSLYLRMNLNERIQHGLMALSFIILVITGFMLHFPDTWWVRHIRDISTDAFEYRSLLHRIAAVIMIGISLYHIIYISATTKGRQLLKDLLPRYEDIYDAIAVAKFNLGLSKEKPKLDRFSYIEKAEYWALIWGTIVMSLTGIIMWFDNTFIGLFTKLGWDVARTIHYFEAWLAFLAIIVWHFYFVIFNPDVYPMSTAWLTGSISEEEMKEEHPKEYEKISSGKDNNQ